MVEYRGYGESGGEPDEEGLQLDAQAGLDFLWSRSDIDRGRIFAFGRSLGGAVAVALGRRNPRRLRGLLIENTFTSVRAMAEPIFPLLKYLPSWAADAMLTSHWPTAAHLRLLGCAECGGPGGPGERGASNGGSGRRGGHLPILFLVRHQGPLLPSPVFPGLGPLW